MELIFVAFRPQPNLLPLVFDCKERLDWQRKHGFIVNKLNLFAVFYYSF